MKTVLIDKDDLITGFGTPGMNPVETMKKVKIKLDNTQEKADLLHHKQQIIAFANSAKQERIISHNDLVKGKKADAEKHHKNFLDYETKIQDTMKLMKPVLKEMAKNERSFIFSEAIYFEPKAGETIITSDDFIILNTKYNKLAKFKRLDKDGKEVSDYRGWKGFKKVSDKWVVKDITKLSETPGDGKLLKDMTEAEISELKIDLESARVSKLSNTAKQTEKDNTITSLANQAALKRSALEIQGESAADALTQATTWYDAEVVKVEAKYT